MLRVSDLHPNKEDLSPKRIAPTPLPVGDIQQRFNDAVVRNTPFGLINVYPLLDNKTTAVVWKVHTDWHWPVNGTLTLEYSESRDPNSFICVDCKCVRPIIYDRSDRYKGQQIKGNYRLVIEDCDHIYTSQPFSVMGQLGYTNYRTMLKIQRAEVRNKRWMTPGVLLKRRMMGDPCNVCNDKLIEHVRKIDCNKCYNTGFIGGYYKPVKCDVYTDPDQNYDTVDGQQRGPINDGEIQMRMLSLYNPVTYDVWCNLLTGERFRIQAVKNITHIQTVPVTDMVVGKHIPMSDPIYRFSITG